MREMSIERVQRLMDAIEQPRPYVHDTVYDKAARKHWYEVQFGTRPNDRRLKTLFAEDDLDAINQMYDIYPDAIIYDVYKTGISAEQEDRV